jgi:flagellar hook assembly protein FlgD
MALAPCRPNPTTGDARLDFVLAREGHVRLVIYDLTGARVRTLVDDTRPSGPGSARWDGRTDRGSAARPGAYFYRLSFGGHDLTRSLVLTR